MDRAEVSRRIKAARMLGGFTNPKDLADSPVCRENGIKASLIRMLEAPMIREDRVPRHAKPMELDVIAEACGLPREFFSASFERLATHRALEERLEALERVVTEAVERVPGLDELRAELARLTEEVEAAQRRGRGGRKRSG